MCPDQICPFNPNCSLLALAVTSSVSSLTFTFLKTHVGKNNKRFYTEKIPRCSLLRISYLLGSQRLTHPDVMRLLQLCKLGLCLNAGNP